MSIDHDNRMDRMVMTCDNCHDDEEFDGDFQECVAIAKRHGWKITKDESGMWFHCCSTCAKGPSAKEDF